MRSMHQSAIGLLSTHFMGLLANNPVPLPPNISPGSHVCLLIGLLSTHFMGLVANNLVPLPANISLGSHVCLLIGHHPLTANLGPPS